MLLNPPAMLRKGKYKLSCLVQPLVWQVLDGEVQRAGVPLDDLPCGLRRGSRLAGRWAGASWAV